LPLEAVTIPANDTKKKNITLIRCVKPILDVSDAPKQLQLVLIFRNNTESKATKKTINNIVEKIKPSIVYWLMFIIETAIISSSATRIKLKNTVRFDGNILKFEIVLWNSLIFRIFPEKENRKTKNITHLETKLISDNIIIINSII
jgi:hypothetical protein